MKYLRIWLWAVFLIPAWAGTAFSHCEIPCGIYDDQARISLMKEDIRTIEKSMHSINDLSSAGKINYNQLIRWVDNKDTHARKFQEIVFQYFMTQRIKVPADDQPEARAKYVHELTLLHRLAVLAMKCKQSTDEDLIPQMQKILKEFSESYFSQKSDAREPGKELPDRSRVPDVPIPKAGG